MVPQVYVFAPKVPNVTCSWVIVETEASFKEVTKLSSFKEVTKLSSKLSSSYPRGSKQWRSQPDNLFSPVMQISNNSHYSFL